MPFARELLVPFTAVIVALARRLRLGAQRNAFAIFVALLALGVRLFWNLVMHPPVDYVFSDMAGYVERANVMLDRPWTSRPDFTLFPYGTHVFVYLIKLLFGRNNGTAIGVAFALLGTGAVLYGYALARRLFPDQRWLPRVVGVTLALYYPWISLGGYVLSETGFSLFLTANAFYTLRFADRGRPGDATLFGITTALGAVFRPQILLSTALTAAYALVRRRTWKRLSFLLVARAALPVALILGISSARTYVHTQRLGLVSTNGPLNFAFGRCHCAAISVVAPDGRWGFGPPSFVGLQDYEKDHPDAFFKLLPASEKEIHLKGHMWDAAPMYEASEACIAKSGWARQLYYAATNVVLLWSHNFIWPDQGQPPRWREPMEISCRIASMVILPGLLLAMATAIARRRDREILVALHFLAVTGTAMAYFGDMRWRAPYDGIFIVLSFGAYIHVGRALLGWILARRSGP